MALFNRSLLIVDDDPDLVRLFQRTFLKRGYDVTATMNANDARHILSEHEFSVIICDMQIGRIRGIDLLREYHDHLAAVGTSVVIVSGHEQFRGVADEIGVEFYISKPVSPHELGDIIDRLMSAEAQT